MARQHWSFVGRPRYQIRNYRIPLNTCWRLNCFCFRWHSLFCAKHTGYLFAPAVQYLFLSIIQSCSWPSEWKLAYITPLHKSGSISCVTNYRPISILPRVSLILEKILFDHIYPRVRAKIVKSQFGFMTKRNTVTQLIHYLDALYDCLDQNIPFSCVYFDFATAFDTVPHDLLIKKLSGQHPGSPVVPPIYKRLTLCYSIHTWFSLCRWSRTDCNATQHWNPIGYQQSLQWADDNGMEFNTTKLKLFPCSYSTQPSKLRLGENPFISVDRILDLGVLISKDLKWKNHILKAIQKGIKVFQFIIRVLPFSLSTGKKLMLYKTLVLSILLYASLCWAPCCFSLQCLENFQKKCSDGSVLAWIMNVPWKDWISFQLVINLFGPMSFFSGK